MCWYDLMPLGRTVDVHQWVYDDLALHLRCVCPLLPQDPAAQGKSEVKRESQISDQPSNNSDARVPVWRVTFMENYVVVRIRPHSQLHLR